VNINRPIACQGAHVCESICAVCVLQCVCCSVCTAFAHMSSLASNSSICLCLCIFVFVRVCVYVCLNKPLK